MPAAAWSASIPCMPCFPTIPTRISPYSPSSRCFVNILYLDVEAVPEFAECEPAQRLVASERFQARLRRLRASELVGYEDVAAAKREVLALALSAFSRPSPGQRQRAGARLPPVPRSGRRGAGTPRAFRGSAGTLPPRRPGRLGLAGLAAGIPPSRGAGGGRLRRGAMPLRVEFFAWLQWLADEQLAALGLQSWRRGLGLGLYQDLALGVSPGGSEAWTMQDTIAAGAHAGAPPDEFNLPGQEWGLPPFVPHRLREAAYAPFIAVLRANMRHCGVLRIDHAMALTRVFWVPAGMPPAQGSLRVLPTRRSARHPGPGKPAQPLPGGRRGSGHRAGRFQRPPCRDRRAFLPSLPVRAHRRRRLQAAGRLSAPGAGGRQHP